MSQPSNPTSKLPFDAFSHFERVASTYASTSGAMKDMAVHLLTLSPPLTSSSVVHDNACGPGIVTGEILSLPQFSSNNNTKTPSAPPTIHATDYSPAMIAALQSRAASENWPTSTLHPAVLDSQSLTTIPSDSITHSYTSAAIFIIPDPIAAAAEIYRTLRPAGEGVAFITTFERQGFISVFHDVQRAVRPQISADELWKGPLPQEWLTEQKLRDVMEKGGFEADKVEVKRFSFWMEGSVWTNLGTKGLRESFTRQCTEGWREEEKKAFERKLGEDLERIAQEGGSYEMKVFCGVGRK